MQALSRASSTINSKQLKQYQDDGFLVVRGLFEPAEMAMASMEADRLLDQVNLQDTKNIRCRWQNHVETGECLFETFDPVSDLSPLCNQLARDGHLLALMADLYGETAHLFKDKLIFKPPARRLRPAPGLYRLEGVSETFATAVVAIDACGKDNGATEVFPGYHKRGYLSPRDGDYHPVPAGMVMESEGVFLEMEPGDVAVFGCFVPHRSAPNRTDRWRRLLYLSYNAASDGGDRWAAALQ